jgi:hypothetical protein
VAVPEPAKSAVSGAKEREGFSGIFETSAEDGRITEEGTGEIDEVGETAAAER